MIFLIFFRVVDEASQCAGSAAMFFVLSASSGDPNAARGGLHFQGGRVLLQSASRSFSLSVLPVQLEQKKTQQKPSLSHFQLFDYIFMSAIRTFICIVVFVGAMYCPIIVVNNFTTVSAAEFTTIIT